jgi:hypothetical protein
LTFKKRRLSDEAFGEDGQAPILPAIYKTNQFLEKVKNATTGRDVPVVAF